MLVFSYRVISEDFVTILSICSEFFNRNCNVFAECDESASIFKMEAGNEMSISPPIRIFQLKKDKVNKTKHRFVRCTYFS